MIFVTGATGNVGADLVRALIKSGQEVRGLVRPVRAGGAPAEGASGLGSSIEAGVGQL